MVFVVEKDIAGLAQVSGLPYLDDLIIWDNGLFPCRIPLRFVQILAIKDRVPIVGKISESLLTQNPKANYGSYMASQAVLPERPTRLILEILQSQPKNLAQISHGRTA